jgi:glycosyltransferase involved in cell wall biosynthesis
MKIAVNCCYYGEKSGGIGEYIYNLVTHLTDLNKESKFIFYVSKDDEKFWQKTMPANLRYKLFPFARNQKIKRALFQNKFWKAEEKKEKFDVFHSPFFHVPTVIKCPMVMTVHDLRFRRYPKSYPFFRYQYIKYAFRKSIKRCETIITVSEFTKKEILKYYRIKSTKISVIHEAINENKFTPHNISLLDDDILHKYEIGKDKFILSVGHLEPRKNYLNLFQAYLELKKANKINCKLIIVGKKNYKYKQELKIINREEDIIYLEFVSREVLLALYNQALCLVFPSIYEGFGFPPLEAAAMNTPSVVSNTSCIPEICGKGALYFDPFDIEDIKDKLERMFTDRKLRNEVIIKASKNLKSYSWEATARKTFKVFQSLQEHSSEN